MYHVTDDPHRYQTLEAAERALLRQLREHRATAVISGRPWQIPNWDIRTEDQTGLDNCVMTAEQVLDED